MIGETLEPWEDLEFKQDRPGRAVIREHIQATSELRRIVSVPRRLYTPPQEAACVEAYTNWLRKPGVIEFPLHDRQAVPLHEIRTYRGGFFQVFAGGGKTLLSFLAPMVANAVNPVLLTDSGLLVATERAAREWGERYHTCHWMRVLGYSALGRTTYYTERDEKGIPNKLSGLLERIDPDMLIADECYALANPRSAVTTRVIDFLEWRYQQRRPVMFVCMSGTTTNDSILSYAHLARYTTPRPWLFLPQNRLELWEWHKCLDKQEVGPGALVDALGAKSYAIEHVRQAYADRMLSTPTVYATKEVAVGASLEMSELAIDTPPEVEEAFRVLRKDWVMPDGWQLEDAPVHWACAQTLCNGYYLKPYPRPPIEWAERRATMARWCRHILTYNRRNLDSLLEVVRSIDAGNEDPAAAEALRLWREIEPTYEMQSKITWISDVGLKLVYEFLRRAERPTLVWVNNTEYGEAIAQWCGVKYFGQKGNASDGTYIEDYSGHAVLSLNANRKGRNLQFKWADNLITFAAPNGANCEQLMARTHRPGQKAHVVRVTFLIGCAEHITGLDKSIENAQYQQDTWKQPQRLIYGHLDRPISKRFAFDMQPRWCKER